MRRTAASVLAASALLLAPVPAVAEQVVADSAAETYRDTRDSILRDYHARTADAQAQLETSADRERAWQEYKRATAEARARAEAQIKAAREEFRHTVEVARGSFR